MLLHQHLFDVLPKDCRIEPRRRGYGKLVHPKCRLRWCRSVPVHAFSVEKIDIPRRSALDSEYTRIRLAERLVRIPVVARARIADQRHAIFDVGLARSQLWNPNEECREVPGWDFRENVLLNFERPPKTGWSSGAHKHDDAYAVYGSIEGGVQWFAVVV